MKASLLPQAGLPNYMLRAMAAYARQPENFSALEGSMESKPTLKKSLAQNPHLSRELCARLYRRYRYWIQKTLRETLELAVDKPALLASYIASVANGQDEIMRQTLLWSASAPSSSPELLGALSALKMSGLPYSLAQNKSTPAPTLLRPSPAQAKGAQRRVH